MSTFLAGVSEVTITPPKGVAMAGYDQREGTAVGIHDDLKAFAVVFDDRRQKSAICVADLIGVKPWLVQSVRRRVSSKTAIPPARIMVAATHTHSGPVLGGNNLLNQKWLRELEDDLVHVLIEADIRHRAAGLGTAVGSVRGVGGNRRDPEHGPVDRSVNVMRIDDTATGRIMAVVVHHACHATTLGLDNLEISADYPGEVRTLVREALPDRPVVVFLNGACGNINPGGYSAEASALGKPMPDRTFARAREIGAVLGKEAVRLARSIETQGPVLVQSAADPLALPAKTTPLPCEAAQETAARREVLDRLRRQGAPEQDIDRARLDVMYAETLEAQATRILTCPNGELRTELQGIAVHDTLFLGMPGEVFTELGTALKQASPFMHTFPVGYANDGMGYFPSIDALRSADGYEVLVSLLGEVAIERFLGTGKALAGRLYKDMEAFAARPAEVKTIVRPTPELKTEEHHPRKAKFPAVDVHVHYINWWCPLERALAEMDATNVRYCATQVGDCLPRAALEPAISVFHGKTDRFIPFCGLDYRRLDDHDWPRYVRRKVEQDMNLGARGIKIFKGLGLEYRDSRGNLVLPDDKRLKPVWDSASELALPVLFHIADPISAFGPIDPTNERYESLKRSTKWWWAAPGFPSHETLIECMQHLAEQNPGTTFIFPHCASLTHDLRRVTAMLKAYPNVYVDISARLNTLGRQPYTARDFFLATPDKILFGSDDMWPNRRGVYAHWFRFLETSDEYWPVDDYYGSPVPWHLYGLGLPDDVLRKVYGENAARLLGLDLQAQNPA